MQQPGAIGVLPQVVNPQMLMLPNNNARRKTKKGSCTTCGRCFGSLFIILFAIICVSCCYAYPIYNSFTNPDYFKTTEKPIWTWKMLFSKVKDIGNSLSIIKDTSEDDDMVNKTGNETVNNNVNNNNTENVHVVSDRKLNMRGNYFNQTDFFKEKNMNKYLNREYCYDSENEYWDVFCGVKTNVRNLECIDMMNGPAICVGIRNSNYEVFLVPTECKFLNPEIPIEIIPTISDYCSNKIQFSSNPKCPCFITSMSASNIIDIAKVTDNKNKTLEKTDSKELKAFSDVNVKSQGLPNKLSNLISYFDEVIGKNVTSSDNHNYTRINS